MSDNQDARNDQPADDLLAAELLNSGDDNEDAPNDQSADNLLADNRRQDYQEYGLKLYRAALNGDWDAARKIHDDHENCFREKITKQGDTALNVAAAAKRDKFVAALVQLLNDEELRKKNRFGDTALFPAATSGVVSIAENMVARYNELPRIANNKGFKPIHMAALYGHPDMVEYLLRLPVPANDLSRDERYSLFIYVINSDLYDIALQMLTDDNDLINARYRVPDTNNDLRETGLHLLARKAPMKSTTWLHKCCCKLFNKCSDQDKEAKYVELVRYFWERVTTQLKPSEIPKYAERPWPLLFAAVEMGNVNFVTTLLRGYPDLIWEPNEKGVSIFHVAVEYRQEEIFRLIHDIGAIKDMLGALLEDESKNGILHMAAKLPPSDRLNCVSGAALQMERELLWYKEVERSFGSHIKGGNKDGITPSSLFTSTHKDLRKEGEIWMRNTASSCSFVATLIATVAFAAIIQMLSDTRTSPLSDPRPSTLRDISSWYWAFAISDSLSLISSTASIVVFLSILSSKYTEEDFLSSLPRKLGIGLGFLIFSIATMLMAFATSFHIIFKQRLLFIVVASLATLILIVFAGQLLPLPLQMFHSTTKNMFSKKSQHQLFYETQPLNQQAPPSSQVVNQETSNQGNRQSLGTQNIQSVEPTNSNQESNVVQVLQGIPSHADDGGDAQLSPQAADHPPHININIERTILSS